MKMTDIRSLSDEDLVTKGENIAEELFRMKFQHGIRQLEDTSKLKSLRKDIARINTARSERKLAAAAA
ncbi:MAG TPA: 50S ribosomal protein L29 [Desulfobacterales bacterium]|nr:50S ribosomal protein L29 [Desulfobacterales bacterium]